ncbi:hypothetical protein EV651_118173 [Kribbella sp. VKM Ac-2571]|uniref:hypothetical protein n=1 Tax=Kribbella sp. VKM Ac-2571 TaxID=2512222 RepID=UPI00105DAA53|nr:hypothetical protein [Kribbella sp. VKM Ac-2571]TDO52151.1 hypothetical protein EV651_118173 [Kribbella sp. VKM Ac-2571]
MNDLLRDTLAERAAGTEPPPLDLDGIIAAGNHRAARRRTLGILGGAVATAAVAVGGASVLRPRNEQPQPARPGPFTQRRATYALGNEIHYGSEVISVAPHTVTAFVQTDAGFVFLNAENAIHVADRSGVRSLGKSSWELAADFRGNLVGWVEGFNDHNESVVYDVATGRELVRTAVGNKIPPNISLVFRSRIIAIDGGTAYFDTVDGPYRWDIRANRGELLAKVPTNAVRAVAAGQIVFQQPLEQRPPAVSLAVAKTVSATAPARFSGQQAFLSPDGRYLVTQPDDAQPGAWPRWAGMNLFGVTATRAAAMPRQYGVYRFGQWLDETTFSAVGVRPGSLVDVVSLITYNARTSALTVVARNFSTWTFSKTAPRTTPFALPTGTPIIDLAE